MRILVVSDVHANLPALEAVIAAAGRVDATWHLGDIVGYGPDPDAVVARLRDLGAIGVRGNHDAAALGGREIELFNVDARRAMEWTKSVITPATREWLAAQPLQRVDDRHTLVHGSPRDPIWEYITSAPVARANLALLETRDGLFGHTHLPIVYRDDRGLVETVAPQDGSTLQLDERRTLLNPGSVGQPRDGDPRASWLVLDTQRNEAQWGRVAYDIAATQAAMRARKLPERLIDRLDYGL
jgi:diadenosine tetraphosphatase ApaH/serine/threonine PP2A family protein phosphatase